ncbi:hypothetical protein FCH28_36015 [Streptomyces piniterrae]|uniref:Guanylate cyclase domain-containing protein n=1 Tax=Streptomyces piniterrae TaxID=2571125 RepID=A0A4U0MME8_9ACTN|nr:hypothetical protein [Streptomyces piniterrae]TJZ41920.1 hypothetical protein FCH28_36015 [Streptomyces piniterrae]
MRARPVKAATAVTAVRAVKTQHYAILVVDIEKFGSRPNPVQAWLRERLYELLEGALDEAGIDHRAEPRPSDRGDGVFWLLPGSVPKIDLTGRFIDLLQAGLRAHARTSNADGALRLRVALHFGEVAWDGRGWVGEDLNTACRIVDLQPLREALGAGQRSGLALAVSDEWYRGVIRHEYPEADSGAYRAVRFDAKEIQGARVWIRVPGYGTPPGIEGWSADGGADGSGDTPGAGDTPAAGDPPGAAPVREGSGGGGSFAGADVHAQQVFGGDQIVHGSLNFGGVPESRNTEGNR